MGAGERLYAEVGAKGGGSLCLLNFASAKNPGGGFLGGSLAQEEALAMTSGLYACQLPHEASFYQPHRDDPSNGLYSHAMLYSPRVPFFREDSGELCAPWYAGVITSPAPNAGVASSKNVSKKQIVETLHERCGRILSVAQEQRHTHLVLGAFGCGVFKNDPAKVATAFDYWLSGQFRRSFKKVVFAIPFDQTNHPVFVQYFDAAAVTNGSKETMRRAGAKQMDAPDQTKAARGAK